jgi:hypothetical protein
VTKTNSGSDAWYEEGLQFSCRRCGSCCTGEPGYVFLGQEEGAAIADFLGLGEETFREVYARKALGRWSLSEEKDGRCVFFTAEGCRIYAVRPRQCRTFPFWAWHLSRPASWDEAARECPGMGKGKLHSREEIKGKLSGRRR